MISRLIVLLFFFKLQTTSSLQLPNKPIILLNWQLQGRLRKLQLHLRSQSHYIKNKVHKDLIAVSRDPFSSESEKAIAVDKYKSAKAENQKLVRFANNSREVERDAELQDSAKVYLKVKTFKSKEASKLKSLKVGNKIYSEDIVADGFYDNISHLKTIHTITATSFERFRENHRHIMEICKSGRKIPRIYLSDASSLLKRMKLSVSDFYSIKAAHYLNGGDPVLVHFQFLLNTVINNIEIAAIH